MINDIRKRFIKTIQYLAPHRHLWETWNDFVSLAALSLSNVFEFDSEREQRYLDIIAKYSPEEAKQFSELLQLTIEALDLEFCDFLGSIFMELELGNHWTGQFFTPYSLSLLTAQMIVSPDDFGDGQVRTLQEPAAGSGCMVIAVCDHLKRNKVNYQRQLKVTAVDVSHTAACMCFIQLSLLGCDATVIHGNTLSTEEYGRYITPMAYVNSCVSSVPVPVVDAVCSLLHGESGEGEGELMPVPVIPAV